MLPPLTSSPALVDNNRVCSGESPLETLTKSVIIILLAQVCLALYGPGGGRGHLQRNLVQQGEQGGGHQFRESNCQSIIDI